ncbi:lycopene cyclase domain-containing protein [Cellulomonas bogoriensis]|uniref:Lycopene cyclase n=1 Tax=Cellulomonas bogoriensis 69B4 = DSM 16987 TaxID=1386082 RepID=A0A0A0BWR6_9CELL|nr:lycopene cyclase domain-containing protein [Cellulomonas bogoriensis]KGM11609.1 lycopene cyclase [Cellulomonas bogoriensis 69B4 = DSM 16987]
MTTYMLINAVFLPVAVVVLLVARWRTGRPGLRAVGLVTAVLLVMTAVFDNIMIRTGLVAYDDDLRLGWSIGVAPVEDFAYAVAAVLLLPALWHLLGPRDLTGDRAARDGQGAR